MTAYPRRKYRSSCLCTGDHHVRTRLPRPTHNRQAALTQSGYASRATARLSAGRCRSSERPNHQRASQRGIGGCARLGRAKSDARLRRRPDQDQETNQQDGACHHLRLSSRNSLSETPARHFGSLSSAVTLLVIAFVPSPRKRRRSRCANRPGRSRSRAGITDLLTAACALCHARWTRPSIIVARALIGLTWAAARHIVGIGPPTFSLGSHRPIGAQPFPSSYLNETFTLLR
jgi:hypothetical protein